MIRKMHLQMLDLAEARSEPFLSKWERLAKDSTFQNPYWSPDICIPALERFASKNCKIACISKGGELLALAPIETHRTLSLAPRVSVLWQHPYLPLGNPLFDEAEESVASQFFRLLGEETGTPIVCPHLDQVILEKIEAEGGLNFLKIEQRERAAIQATKSTGMHYRRQNFSTSRRKDIDRHMRRLEDKGKVTIALSQSTLETREKLEEFLELEFAGWKGRNGTALLNKKQDADFAREIVSNMAEKNACYIATLNLDGKCIASLVVFHHEHEHFAWKTAYDETFSSHSPGTQLLARFSDRLMGGKSLFSLDSCTTPDNESANAVLRERIASQTIIISDDKTMTAARITQSLLMTKSALKNSIKTMVK